MKTNLKTSMKYVWEPQQQQAAEYPITSHESNCNGEKRLEKDLAYKTTL